MYIIVGYILAIILLKIIFTTKEKYNIVFLLIAGIMLTLIVSMRNLNFGSDTLVYIQKFKEYSLIDYSIFIDYLNSVNEKDKTFYILIRTLNNFGIEGHLLIAILATIFLIAIFWLIYKYSHNNLLSIILFISLGYLFFSLTGLRQTLALSLIIFSYKYIRERKLIKFVLLVLFASLFHSTAIIFLIAYPFAYVKLGMKHILILSAAIITNSLFYSQVNGVLEKFIVNDQYEYYLNNMETLNYSGFFIQLIIFIFCVVLKKNLLPQNPKDISLYNLIFIGLLIQLFSTNIAVAFRISLYFSIFSIILIPNIINSIKNINIKILLYIIIIPILLLYLYLNNYYDGFTFYW
ncbi:EpsG family protein [Staphylococcus equorum]|uniref:EpsG family protein n=1 Tax=Staphylococcus equorum TaxID=246432 RepID=UPI0020CDD031|nr:EpsG family protein [Staphylococcus equorum]MEB7715533.1 EpsG family protein [Staphylococcus equorum]MEB7759888.1 EpsG family protein [Staphylococcus equorum]MEB7762363.1 EpsG family protein [Staphylococcus equorum]MEB7793471.1 EpsG family protein [Staphylococcus equorum]UTT55867.1 EpsG family protein [Staphylococcus equorum]